MLLKAYEERKVWEHLYCKFGTYFSNEKKLLKEQNALQCIYHSYIVCLSVLPDLHASFFFHCLYTLQFIIVRYTIIGCPGKSKRLQLKLHPFCMSDYIIHTDKMGRIWVTYSDIQNGQGFDHEVTSTILPVFTPYLHPTDVHGKASLITLIHYILHVLPCNM